MAKNYTLGTPPFLPNKKPGKAKTRRKERNNWDLVGEYAEFDRAGAGAMIDGRVSPVPQLAASLTGGTLEVEHAPPLKGTTVE